MNRKKTYWLLAKSQAIIFTLLFGIVLTANTILMENAAAVSTFLGVEQQEIVEDENAAEKDTQYYKSDFNSVAEVRTRGMKLIEEVVSEGTVLLKNDDALPLKSGDAVSLFSTSSVDLVTAGSGSSLSSG